MFFFRNSYYRIFKSPFLVHNKGSFIELAVTGIYCLALNCLCLVWVSLLTTHWSSVVQPPPITRAGYAIPLCQTKKAILFVCLLWLFLLVTMCVLSLSLYPSWHAPGGSNSSLFLLGGMSSQQDISPKRI